MYTLITAATSSLAYQHKNKLASKNVILGDYMELPAFMLKDAAMIRLPNPASIAYTHEMLTLCLDKEIDTVYPLKQEEATLLSKAEQLFTEYGITIMPTVSYEL